MSDKESTMKDALAAKRKKLEMLKQKREERRKQKEAQLADQTSKAAATVLEDAKRAAPSSSAGMGATDLLSDISRLVGDAPSSQSAAGGAASPAAGRRAGPVDMKQSVVFAEDIPPMLTATYDVGCQTGADSALADAQAAADEEESERKTMEERAAQQREKQAQEMEDKLREELDQAEAKARNLDAAQKKSILLSQEFKDFFARSSVLLERALHQNESYDITIDYSEEMQSDHKEESSVLMHGVKLYDRNRAYNRPVTAIDWSPLYKELLLTAYAQQEDTLSLEPDGLVQVWSLHMSQRPEYQFYCQSAVLTAQFHPSSPRLIIGGTHSGQVVIWDTREKSTPINRTSLSNGHTSPLYSLAAIPSVSLHNIISASTDGQLRVWNDNDLVEPLASLDLVSPEKTQSQTKKDVAISCLAFPKTSTTDSNTVVLGSDEGKLYKARVYPTSDSQPGIYDMVEKAHSAPMTQVAFHPLQKNSPREIGNLFLTSSLDWSVKLWASTLFEKPLFTFDVAKDYVYDVQWSPTHPSVFAMGDGAGAVTFWDLNKETDVPVASASINAEEKSEVGRAVSRLKWADDGKKIAVGTSEGATVVYDVAPTVSEPPETATTEFYDKMKRYMNKDV